MKNKTAVQILMTTAVKEAKNNFLKHYYSVDLFEQLTSALILFKNESTYLKNWYLCSHCEEVIEVVLNGKLRVAKDINPHDAIELMGSYDRDMWEKWEVLYKLAFKLNKKK